MKEMVDMSVEEEEEKPPKVEDEIHSDVKVSESSQKLLENGNGDV